jgi:predicted helicase
MNINGKIYTSLGDSDWQNKRILLFLAPWSLIILTQENHRKWKDTEGNFIFAEIISDTKYVQSKSNRYFCARNIGRSTESVEKV